MLTSHKQGISSELLAESESDRTVLEATQEASFDGNYHTNFAAFRATIEQSMIELHDRKREKTGNYDGT
jgi:hypothetical protein